MSLNLKRPFPRVLMWCAMLSLVTCWSALVPADEPEQFDVRVLIDVSGSMKSSDPGNLRQPALRLLLTLLPENSRSGVWLFDGSVTELAKPGTVTPLWKNKALQASMQIHSDGMLTDIEKAIQTATFDWSAPEQGTLRSLILLTDGVVDVSRDAFQNVQSRQRILKQQLQPLIDQGVRINTIALSQNADDELLEVVASKSGGWHETATSADQLQRVFLEMFKKSVRHDSLPIKNNRFFVDRSIREFSAILFRSGKAAATQLDDPEGMDFGRESDRDNVQWRHEPGYDIVTVIDPMEGEWNFVAQADPDNEIMIVTDLKMHVSSLPNEIHRGSTLPVDMYVTEGGKRIDKQMFLDIFRVKFELTDSNGQRTDLGMRQDPDRPGVFIQKIGEQLDLGQYALTIEVDGSTFKRQHKLSFDVVPPPLPSETPQAAPPEVAPEPVRIEPIIDPFQDMEPVSPEPVFEPPVIEPVPAPPIPDAPPPAADVAEPVAEPEAGGMHWLITLGIALVVNLLLGAGGYFGYKKFKSKDAAAEAELINQLST